MKKLKHLMLFENYCIIGRVETVTISNENGDSITKEAKIDTASKSTRICKDIAADLKLPVVDNKKVWNELGEEERTFVELQININGIEVKTIAGITDMSDLSVDIIIGYRDIETINGIIDVNKTNDAPVEELPMEEPDTEEIPMELPTEELEDGEISKTGFYIEGEIERKE
jgi:hypothetical protein